MLENTINLDEFIPTSFYHNFYASTGRPREYKLHSMLWALIIQRIFSIPTDTLLITFLKYSSDLREFCGFRKVPDGSKFTRFKQDFLMDLQTVFDNLVDVTEPICQEIDQFKASMTIFDTSGIEAFVTENNPKYANRIIKQLKAFKKNLKALMILMIHIKLHMDLCLHMLLVILKLNSFILMDIFVMFISLAWLPMVSAL